jgi:branched-chain amino acid transport system substrate-binding protein
MAMKIAIVIFLWFLSCLSAPAQKGEPVKIGFLVQDQNSLAARQGAELAVKDANNTGGFNGRPFQLIVKSMEGPWGTGSKQAVDLIFNDQVWALLGSHDGRNGHLVEQAATKSIVVFVSAWSSDPTLSQAFVPWFYNVIPTDIQQGKMLCDDIYSSGKISKVAVISDQSYDSKQSVKGFFRVHDQLGKTRPAQFVYEDYSGNDDLLAEDIQKSDAGAVILFCQPAVSFRIISLLKAKKLDQVIYASVSVLNEDILRAEQLKKFNGVLVPAGNWSTDNSMKFAKAYYREFNRQPGMVAFYSYDATSLLIEAIKKCGSNDREVIEKTISSITFNGLTGQISFDKSGNRSDAMRVKPVQDGLPLKVIN